jgi:hypothetical protein
MAWRDLDLLKFRVDKIRLSAIAPEMRKYSGVPIRRDEIIKLLGELGCNVPDGEDPDIFFVVRADDYEEIKAPAPEGEEPIATALLGRSPSVALTEEMVRHRFEVQVKNHNEKLA